MSNEATLLEKDLFQFGVPLLKSFQVDENGDVIVEGIASVPKQDLQGEDLDPRGFVLNYFEKSGWIKWEHKAAPGVPAGPDQFIGEPIEARITPEGAFYLKARLYRDSKYTQQIKDQLELLEKSQSSRKMGFSIEGQAIQRDPHNKLKVLKAIIRNVVLTMNPVNDGTWVTLSKSLTSPEALDADLDEDFSLEKAMDTASAAAIMPQSLEGVKPDDDEDEDDETAQALKTFCSFVKKLLNKSLGESLIGADSFGVVQGAYDHAVDSGLSHAKAVEFAGYVHQKQGILKSVSQIAGRGGAGMKKRLSEILGESMDALEKSLTTPEQTDEDELDSLIKSLEDKGDGDGDEGQGGAGDGDGDEGEGGEDKLEKSMTTDSLQTLDVSVFLQDLVKSLNDSIGTFSEDQEALGQGLAIMAKAMKTQNELIKSLQTQVEELGVTPRGRRSAVTPNDVKTVTRRGGEMPTDGDELNKSQVMELLHSGVKGDKIPFGKITAFEMGYGVDPQTAKAIGLDLSKHPQFMAR